MPNFAAEDPEKLEAPDWLTEGAQKIFTRTVSRLIAAGVPIKQADEESVALYSACLDEIQVWSKIGKESTPEMRMKCSQFVARLGRDVRDWGALIGASPKSRAQMGLRGKAEAKKLGAVASILAAKRGVG